MYPQLAWCCSAKTSYMQLRSMFCFWKLVSFSVRTNWRAHFPQAEQFSSTLLHGFSQGNNATNRTMRHLFISSFSVKMHASHSHSSTYSTQQPVTQRKLDEGDTKLGFLRNWYVPILETGGHESVSSVHRYILIQHPYHAFSQREKQCETFLGSIQTNINQLCG